jgi:Carboxypeptidase regulatory-like domain
MRSSIVRAVTVTLEILLSSLLVFSQTQTTSKAVKPVGSISGRVTIKEKAAPGIAVALRGSDFFNPYDVRPRAVTDQDGNYKIANVAAGSYEVVFGALGYIPTDVNSRSRSVVVGDGENIENINFALVRGGVITGRITDADGRPAIQQAVRLFRADPPNPRTPQSQVQERPLSPANTSTTDDRGIYRMFGLMPGRYKVSAGRGDNVYPGGGGPIGRVSYKEVFFPDATDHTKATVLEVSEGSETTNIDITLGRPFETFSARGRVINGEKGEPVANVRFTLQRVVGDQYEFTPQFVMSNALGGFSAEGLIPGKYSVFMMSDTNSDLRAENTSFDIIDADVTGVTVRVVKGASISGIVVLETEDKRAFAKLTQLELQAYVQNPNAKSMGSSSRATIGGDGSFRFGGLGDGIANLSINPVNALNQIKGFMLSRVERDGVVQRRGLEVKEGEQITGVRVIVNYGTATIRGFVTIENGPLPPGARIFVRLLKAGEVPTIRPPNVDERGRFLVEGLPAGSYEISVSVSGPGLKPRPPVKQDVVLQDGVVSDVTITLDLAGQTPP